MTITYTYKKGLYLNITNKCTNRCTFCLREYGDTVYGSPSLRLEREPSYDEIIADLKYSSVGETHDLSVYDEIVFCGYGEPTCRLYDMLKVCRYIKENSPTPISIRVNTNGHASMITGDDTPPMFSGLVDIISISLNASDAKTYTEICHPKFGDETYTGLLKFIRDITKYVPKVVVSVVRGTLPDEQIPKCAQIADEFGVEFRIREKE